MDSTLSRGIWNRRIRCVRFHLCRKTVWDWSIHGPVSPEGLAVAHSALGRRSPEWSSSSCFHQWCFPGSSSKWIETRRQNTNWMWFFLDLWSDCWKSGRTPLLASCWSESQLTFVISQTPTASEEVSKESREPGGRDWDSEELTESLLPQALVLGAPSRAVSLVREDRERWFFPNDPCRCRCGPPIGLFAIACFSSLETPGTYSGFESLLPFQVASPNWHSSRGQAFCSSCWPAGFSLCWCSSIPGRKKSSAWNPVCRCNWAVFCWCFASPFHLIPGEWGHFWSFSFSVGFWSVSSTGASFWLDLLILRQAPTSRVNLLLVSIPWHW